MTHPRLSRAAARGVQSRVAAEEPFELDLTDLDLELLDLVCGLRVVTQTQLQRLHPDVPPRTVRYRTRRLHRLKLIGRTRPYREQGSAPHHLWPTNRADALVRGERPARRGERRPPNPLFLAHAAMLSELFVVLHTQAPRAQLRLLRFDREGDAREDFHDTQGQQRAIVPDARLTLTDPDGTPLVGNVELDLGTMTHARLRMKLRGFLAHAHWHTNTGDGTPPPTLLFITTSTQRTDTFLAAAHDIRSSADATSQRLTIAACAAVPELHAAIVDRCWRTAGDPRLLRLADCLQTTHQPERPTLDLQAAALA